MKLVTWAVGSAVLSVALALAVTAVGSAAPAVRAGEFTGCPHARAAAQPVQKVAARPAPVFYGHHNYIIATRMGWAIS